MSITGSLLGAVGITNPAAYLGIAFLGAQALMLALGYLFTTRYAHLFRSKAREWTPERHKQKDNTPTMGGLCILAAALAPLLLLTNLANPIILLFITLVAGFGLLGLLDDYHKLTYKRGISARAKSGGQIALSFAIGLILWQTGLIQGVVYLPFCSWGIPIGILAIPWFMFVVIGASNGVNLTDGLDGLAAGSLVPNFLLFAGIHWIQFTKTAHVDSLCLATAAAAFAGACWSFLHYNRHPARMFMGDVGSLALGGALGYLALMTRWELLLCVTGLVFIVETLSVMLQVWSYKYRGKRLFKMAPIHHHFELSGYSEGTIVRAASVYSWFACLAVLLIGAWFAPGWF